VTRPATCEYCGLKGAKGRAPGEPPTCYTHRDLPALELARSLEVDRLVADLYESAGRSARGESQPTLEG